MKKIFALLLASLAAVVSLCAKDNTEYAFIEASKLTLVGKIMDTPNPYHRVDTCVYKGFTKAENALVRNSSGLAVLFRTDSPVISVKTVFGAIRRRPSTMNVATSGYDLYIKKDGKWLFAGARTYGKNNEENVVLISNMNGEMKECMVYLPMYSEEYSVKIGVKDGSVLEPLESPFRHRICFFGSSYTMGCCVSHTGMGYPLIFQRSTGLQPLALGVSGNSKLQPAFADLLADVQADAFVFDCFSNPSAQLIEERLEAFVKRVSEAHPGVPLIFQQTIFRTERWFDMKAARKEEAKMAMVEKLMPEIMEKYKDVYFIRPDLSAAGFDFFIDGDHPTDYGYYVWEQSIEKPILEILSKYGIR